MYWNYRVVKKLYGERDENQKIIDPDSVYNEYQYAIHEVFFDENGKATMCTINPVEPFGDNVIDLITCWVMMGEAFKHPIMNYDDIPEEGAKNEVAEAIKEAIDEEGNFIEEVLDTDEVFSKLRTKFDFEDFDLKEFRNEQATQQLNAENFFKKEFEGKSFAEVFAAALETFLNSDYNRSDDD